MSVNIKMSYTAVSSEHITFDANEPELVKLSV